MNSIIEGCPKQVNFIYLNQLQNISPLLENALLSIPLNNFIISGYDSIFFGKGHFDRSKIKILEVNTIYAKSKCFSDFSYLDTDKSLKHVKAEFISLVTNLRSIGINQVFLGNY